MNGIVETDHWVQSCLISDHSDSVSGVLSPVLNPEESMVVQIESLGFYYNNKLKYSVIYSYTEKRGRDD